MAAVLGVSALAALPLPMALAVLAWERVTGRQVGARR